MFGLDVDVVIAVSGALVIVVPVLHTGVVFEALAEPNAEALSAQLTTRLIYKHRVTSVAGLLIDVGSDADNPALLYDDASYAMAGSYDFIHGGC